MKKLALVTLLVALIAPMGAGAELPTPDKKSLDYYQGEHKSFPSNYGEPLDSWEDALVASLGRSDPDTVADELGRRFDLSAPQMRELVRLWLFTHANLTNMDRTQQQQREMRERFLALATASQHAPLVLQAAAASIFHES